MTTKAELRQVLDALIGDADEQTQMHERAQQRLYLTLGGAYLWWREARKVEGFLEELYAEKRLVHRGNEENFTRLVRLVWQLGWDGMTPKVQNWARALRGLHHEYETNKDAYQVQNPQDKVRQFFQAMGGIGAVGNSVSPLQLTDEEIASAKTKVSSSKKTKLDILSEQQIRVKHIELGELFFAAEDPYIKNIVSKSKKLDVTRKGYAVALVKKSANGSYDLVSVTSNDDIVHQTIVETYKRNDDALPQVLRTLCETIHILETKSKWLDWFSKFGEKIELMQGFSEAEKQLFLRGVVEKITVSTLDTQAHEVVIRFKIPYVNDTFEWKNPRARGQGYTLGEGEKEMSVGIETQKKTPQLKQ